MMCCSFMKPCDFQNHYTRERLTTYLNRDADNESLSKSINRTFMLSWLRALSYINQQFPDDLSKERMLARRLEWLIYDFCIRRNTGYPFSKRRLQDFKVQMDQYLGELNFDPSPYFRSDVRQIIWTFYKLTILMVCIGLFNVSPFVGC